MFSASGHLSRFFTLPNTSCVIWNRRLGHPTVRKLRNVLKRATGKKAGEDKPMICCDVYVNSANTAKNTAKPPEIKCHHTRRRCCIQTLNILRHPHHPRYFRFGSCGRSHSSSCFQTSTQHDVWRIMKSNLSVLDRYLPFPPDIVTHDAGTNFFESSFQANADMLHIKCKQIPIEVANIISLMEIYHEPLRRAFNIIICDECPTFTFDEALLSAVKSLNDSTGADVPMPTLLVFGAMPRLGTRHDTPPHYIAARATAISKAKKAIYKSFTQRQAKDARKTQNGPDTTEILGTPLCSYVPVYRERESTGNS